MTPPDIPPPLDAVVIDERWMGEWLEYGYDAIRQLLTRHANFAAWCEENDRKEPIDG